MVLAYIPWKENSETSNKSGVELRKHQKLWSWIKKTPKNVELNQENTRKCGVESRKHQKLWSWIKKTPEIVELNQENTRKCGVESRKHQKLWSWIKKTPEVVGPIFQCHSILIFPLWNRGIIVIPHCQTTHFMFCIDEIQVFLDDHIHTHSHGILKWVYFCENSISNSILLQKQLKKGKRIEEEEVAKELEFIKKPKQTRNYWKTLYNNFNRKVQ